MKRLACLAFVLVGCHLDGGLPPPPPTLAANLDGLTNADGLALVVPILHASDASIATVSVATWPALDPVPATVTPTFDGYSIDYVVEPDGLLGPAWYAIVVEPSDPRTTLEVLGDPVWLDDGRFAYRLYGASAPRIHEAMWRGGTPGTLLEIRFSEALELSADGPPIVVTADGVECEWVDSGGGVADHTAFRCSAERPSDVTIEVVSPMSGPGGGALDPQFRDVPYPLGYRAPIG